MNRKSIGEDAEGETEKWPLPSVFGTSSGKGLFTAAESEDWLLQSDFGSYEPVSSEEFEQLVGLVPGPANESEELDGEIDDAGEHARDSDR